MDELPKGEIPDINQLKEGFDKLEALDLTNLSFHEIKQLYFKHIPFLPHVFAPKSLFKGQLFRVRTNVKQNEDISKIDTFSTCPVEFTTMLRANIDKHPVFYCSPFASTALSESKEYFNEIMYLGVWKISKEDHINMAQFTFDNIIPFDDIWQQYNKAIQSKLMSLKSNENYNKRHLEAMTYLSVRIGNLFVGNNYSLSSFIAHSLLYNNTSNEFKIDIIQYPSIADKFGFNFAIQKEFVTNMELEKVVELKVTNQTTDDFELEAYRIGINENNIISWRSIISDDLQFLIENK